MNVSIEDLRWFVKQCDPAVPLDADDDRYVDLDAGTPVRGRSDTSCIEVLKKTIILSDPDGQTCQLFTGFPGAGKTTELKRLVADLDRAQDCDTKAIYVDMDQFLDRFGPLSITDVLRVLAVQLDRAATAAEGNDPDAQPGYLKRFYEFLQTDVEFKGLQFEAYGPKLMLELKNNPSFRAKAEAALRLRFQQFADGALDAMSQAVVRLRKALDLERVVVIADSLEKMTPLREEDRGAMEASVEAVFLQHAQFLRIPCHAIFTFPIWLRFRTAGLGGFYDGEPLILPMVKIKAQDDQPYAEGIRKLRTLIAQRIDVPRIFGPGADGSLDALIHASGGYPRDLLRLVREVLRRAGRFPVEGSDIAAVVDALAEDYARVIRETDLEILCEVAETHQVPRSDAAKLAAFGRLLERWLVLAYRNGGEWYELHPLVRRAQILQDELEARAS